LDDINNIQLLDFTLSAISIIGVPLSRWLPKRIIYFIINKNISALLRNDTRGSKWKKDDDYYVTANNYTTR
jgi:hypothetical protein